MDVIDLIAWRRKNHHKLLLEQRRLEDSKKPQTTAAEAAQATQMQVQKQIDILAERTEMLATEVIILRNSLIDLLA